MENFTTLVVFRGLLIEPNEGQTKEQAIESFYAQFLEHTGIRVKYMTEYKTLPTPGEPETGGRIDVILGVHNDDVGKMTFFKLRTNGDISWWDDALVNDDAIIPYAIKNKYREKVE